VTTRVTWDTQPRLVTDAEATRAVEVALEHGGRPGIEVEVLLVSDTALTELHGRFLGDPTPTDVITFDLGDGGGPEAEIYVSVDCALRVAADRAVEPARELALYLVHGALHLCGFDDHEDEDRTAMRTAEREVLASLGYAPDASPHDA
jgi:probable rRNA maturation factor